MTNQNKSEMMRAIMRLEMWFTGFLILDSEKELLKQLFRNTNSIKNLIEKYK